MTDLDYRKIYCECYNKCLTYEKYLPVKDYLYKIIGSFKEAMSYELDFTRDILHVFDLIMQENKYDNLDSYIDFLINIHTPPYEVGDFLELFLFKEEKFDNKEQYYIGFQELCHLINVYEFDKNKFKDFRLDGMVKTYQKYHNSLPFQGINNKNTSILIYFEKYAPIIMGYFYLTDKPIEYLDSLFNKLIYNYDELYVKGVLSGICDMEHFRSTLGDNGEYQYFQYMVDNGISMGSHYIK